MGKSDNINPRAESNGGNMAVQKEAIGSQVHDTLLNFVDFIYAVVFGLVVQETFDKIISAETIHWYDKILSATTVAAVFYFLAWDWLLGRILTFRNPYKSYTRFFCEISIAVFAYGAAKAVVNGKLTFLLYIAGILVIGVLWARQTSHHRHLNHARDRRELCVVSWVQSIGCVNTVALYYFLSSSGNQITPEAASLIIPAFWWFIFCYELLVPRPRGLTGGAGVPFLSRPDLRKIRRLALTHLT